MPKVEKEEAVVAAKKLGISDSEFIRMAIIWLQRRICNGTVDVLTNSALIPVDTEAKTSKNRVVKNQVARLKAGHHIQESQS